MCILIDSGGFSPVFNENNELHDEFKPVKDWVLSGAAIMVYGGSTFLHEIQCTPNFYKLLLELNRTNKAISISCEMVDKEEDIVKTLEPNPDFDDHHLVAIARVSGCRIICLNDRRAHRFIRDLKFYPVGRRPKIYCNRRHGCSLLCPRNSTKPLNPQQQ